MTKKINSKVKISIILPVFNEGKNIGAQINLIEKNVKIAHEILIVYDFEEDDTIPTVRKLQKKIKNLHLVKNIYGRGVISAIKTGVKKARSQTVVIMPADLADNPATINKMYKEIKNGFDIVGATRYTKGGSKIGGQVIKTLLSRFAGLATPLLLGIPTTDIANGFKMYRKEIFEKIKIESTGGWEFSTELIIKAYHKGFKITELPTVWRDRTQGESKFKLLKWLPKYIRWYLVGVGYRLNIYGLIF